jgi:hypothetical protein
VTPKACTLRSAKRLPDFEEFRGGKSNSCSQPM